MTKCWELLLIYIKQNNTVDFFFRSGKEDVVVAEFSGNFVEKKQEVQDERWLVGEWQRCVLGWIPYNYLSTQRRSKVTTSEAGSCWLWPGEIWRTLGLPRLVMSNEFCRPSRSWPCDLGVSNEVSLIKVLISSSLSLTLF